MSWFSTYYRKIEKEVKRTAERTTKEVKRTAKRIGREVYRTYKNTASFIKKQADWIKDTGAYQTFSTAVYDIAAFGGRIIREYPALSTLVWGVGNLGFSLGSRLGAAMFSVELIWGRETAAAIVTTVVSAALQAGAMIVGTMFGGPFGGAAAAYFMNALLTTGTLAEGYYSAYVDDIDIPEFDADISFQMATAFLIFPWFPGSDEWDSAMPGGSSWNPTDYVEPWEVMMDRPVYANFDGLNMITMFDGPVLDTNMVYPGLDGYFTNLVFDGGG